MGTFLRPSKKSLQNPQHYEFMNAFLTVIADSGLSATKITTLVSQLTTAFSEEDRCFLLARASALIAQREEADRRRDNFYGRLHRLTQVWAGSGEPTKDPAATMLLAPFKLYKVNTSAQIERESGQLSNLITDLLTTEMQDALTAIGGTYLFQEMKTAHELVQSLRLEEGIEHSTKVTGALVAARKACDALYDQITYLIEAYCLTADDPAPYEAFITRWNGTLDIYQDMLDRKSGTSSGSGSGGGGSTENGNDNVNVNDNENGDGNGGSTPDPGTGGGGTTPDPGTGGGTPDPGTGGDSGGDNGDGGDDNGPIGDAE